MKNAITLVLGMLVAGFAMAQSSASTAPPTSTAPKATATAPAITPSATAPATAATPQAATKETMGASGATAAATTAPADEPSKDDVMKLLAALHVRQNMSESLDNMRDQIKQGSRQGFQMQRLEPTPEQLAQVDGMIDKMFTQVPYEEMLQAMVPVYQKHFTKAEMESVVNFYGSAAGQKLLKEQPEMMNEGMQAGGAAMQAKMEPLMKQLDEDMKGIEAQMKKAPEPAAATPKKAPGKSGTGKSGATKPKTAKTPAATASPKP